jgi:L-ascorbate metabolism protein UlaG (beta-lactamase superfamily)
VGALLLAGVGSTGGLSAFGGRLEGARLERARRSPHFVDGRFVNPIPTHKLAPGAFWEMVRHQLFGGEARSPRSPIPIVQPEPGIFAALPASGLRVTWLGHSTTLVEIDGYRVLTDPVWSERCSPSTLIGPKRFHPPPLALRDLPPIDVAVISHDHFDHLDMATVKALAARGTRFAVPLGVGAHLEAFGIGSDRFVELDWGESTQVGGLTLVATPARHYSGRNPFLPDRTLWASWVLRGPVHRVFFSGDSGYFDGFAAIGAEHGPFDVTLLKIGASDRTWQEIHMSPEEAVRAHRDLRGALLLPVHWGTFNLAFHAWNDPPDQVLAAARQAGVSLVVPRPGQPVEQDRPPPVEPWWR